jgi:small subunit ribosomal protein S6
LLLESYKKFKYFHAASSLIVQKDQFFNMNNYEMMYILRPDLAEEAVQEVSSKYKTMLQESGAADIQVQVRGKRHLAYPIQNFNDGIYIQVNYKADGSQIKAIERDMRLGENVIRYLTMKLDAEPVAVEAESGAPSAPAAPGA